MATTVNKIGELNGGWAILFRVTLVSVPILCAMVGWMATAVIANGQAIAEIRANRFTSDDGLEVWKAISDIKQDIARFPSEVPPRWFLNRVDKIDERLGKIENRLSKIQENSHAR